ncbi:hypothetical protein EGW08_004248 [Elysia chlorotica]|uniref:Uncharacterized protein n=1 Tax=Elysia chlorotica TaxID=188477 RepID=A0A3S1BGR4_ELYCH|nr:hypothetical protein EGW08_004248 [Elysia chlorotica]
MYLKVMHFRRSNPEQKYTMKTHQSQKRRTLEDTDLKFSCHRGLIRRSDEESLRMLFTALSDSAKRFPKMTKYDCPEHIWLVFKPTSYGTISEPLQAEENLENVQLQEAVPPDPLSLLFATSQVPMRTKVERKQRMMEEKIKLNMPLPKVVLDASDCARLLDGAGKTSVVVVEREGKIVAASSVAASSEVGPSVAVPASKPSLKSTSIPEPKDSAPEPDQPAMATAQSLSHDLSGSNGAKDNDTAWKSDTSPSADKDGLSSGRKAGSDQGKAILKPPKKRRGIEAEFEIETPSQSVLNNCEPQLPPLNHQLTAENNFSKSLQRHSVERILQQNSVISTQSHHYLPHSHSLLSAGMEIVSSSSAQTSVPSTLSQPLQDSLSSDQIHHEHCPYPSLALQSDSATHIHLLPKNSPCNSHTHENTLGKSTPNRDVAHDVKERTSQKTLSLSPEQDEPINLSTGGKTDQTVVSPITSQAGITTPAEGCEPDLTISKGDKSTFKP